MNNQNPVPLAETSVSSQPEKFPCYDVYDHGKSDSIVFRHEEMRALQERVYLLLDSLEAGESIRIEFCPRTQEELDTPSVSSPDPVACTNHEWLDFQGKPCPYCVSSPERDKLEDNCYRLEDICHPTKVERFDPELDQYYYGGEFATMKEHPHGEYVKFSDYELLAVLRSQVDRETAEEASSGSTCQYCSDYGCQSCPPEKEK